MENRCKFSLLVVPFLTVSFVLLTCSIFGQVVSPKIGGITTRILPYATKTMAEIVAKDQSQIVPLNFIAPLRPEHEGPQPKINPAALISPLKNSFKRNTGLNTETATQRVHSNFLAIWGAYKNNIPGRESAYTPPDNCGDVGTSQVIATANTRLKVFTKPIVTGPGINTPTGTSTQTPPATFNVDLNTFFSNETLKITNISDPHIRFDRLTKRWFIVAIDVDHDVDNYCCIAVSNNDVITSSSVFNFYYFNVSQTGGKANEFFDYPTLGVDRYALNIGGNMFANALTYAGSNMWVVNKDSLIAGVLKVTGFDHSTTKTDMYTPQGVQNDDATAPFGYFIGSSQSLYSKLVIRRIDHTSIVPVLSADINLNTIQTYAPNTVIIPLGDSIDGNDHRLCAAMMMKNKITGKTSLWTAQGSSSDITGNVTTTGDRDGIVWFEIGNMDISPSIVQSSRVFDANTPEPTSVNYIYPTIATSGQGHSIMGFTSAGKSKYPQATVAGRYRTDPGGVFQLPVDLTNATSRYNPGASRWGDFTQTVVDPIDNMTMWTFTQYADTVNSWGVRAGQLIAPPPSVPKLDTVPICNTSTIIVSGISINNSEFFDPGDDKNGPGFNRLTITVTGPSAISVTNIKLINQDTISASFNLPDGTLAGTYVVTVTNPDGQSSTTSFVLAATCSAVKIIIVDFSGKKVKDGVELNWTTMNEENITHFILEKSGDSLKFENFASIVSKGNATSTTVYSAIDHHPFPNFSYYRLKIYNTDGNFLYSRIIKVATDQKNIALTRLYPNPASSTLNLELFSTQDAAIVANVFDFSGRKVISESFQLGAGLNTKLLNISTLSKAGYIIQFFDINNNLIDKSKFLKQ